MAESKECFEKRSLKKGSVNWVLLMSLEIACAISGDFSGWSTGTGYGSARAPDPRRAHVPARLPLRPLSRLPAAPPAAPSAFVGSVKTPPGAGLLRGAAYHGWQTRETCAGARWETPR